MSWALVKTFGPWAIIVALFGLIAVLAKMTLGQHDQLVTWRLRDKDQQAIAYNLRRDIGERDDIITGRSQVEAADRGEADGVCSAEISTSFQKGVAVGRAVERHASSSAPASRAAAGGKPGPRIVRDYRQAWSAGAYVPATP